MKKVVLISFVSIFLFCAGSFVGFEFATMKAPDIVEFGLADKFMDIVQEEVSKYEVSNAYGFGVKTTWRGSEIYIFAGRNNAGKNFVTSVSLAKLKNIAWRRSKDGITVKESWEETRPLAIEVAKKIIENQN